MSFSYIVSYATSQTGPWTQAGTSSTASFTINNLSVGTNYWVQIIAVDSITGLQSSPAVAGPFQTGSVTQESPNLTAVTSSSQTIYSSQTPGQPAPSGGPFDTWTITGQGGQVIHNGVTDSTTSSVMQIFYSSHTVYHEESNGNSFGTPGWWQWTGTTNYPSATPGSGSFTDTKGNTWSLNVSGNPVVNGLTDTVSHAQKIYLIGSTVWQIDTTNSWYSFTPSGTITSTSQLSWAGPTTTSPITGWAACASPSGVPLTITGISLSNNTVSNTAPSGATVGAITVTMSSGTFSGSLALSGANASSFQVSGGNLITSAANLTAGNYSIGLTATQASASNSPFGPSAFTIVSQASTGGPGPAATSPFLTVDFSSPQNYPNGGTGQQVVSQRMYGCYIGWGGDANRNGNPNAFSAYTDNTWTSQLAKVNPGLHMITGNLYPNGWFNSDNTVNPTAWANLINNFYKVDPLGISGIMLGMDFSYGTPANYAAAFQNFAKYIQSSAGIMPNGKRLPLIGFGSTNENGADQAASYFNAYMPLVRAVNSSYVCIGPQPAFYDGTIQSFLANTNSPKPDGVSWDFFNAGDTGNSVPIPTGSTLWNPSGLGNSFAGSYNTLKSQLPAGYTPKMTFPGGNISFNCNIPDEDTIHGAMFWAVNWWNGLSQSPWPMWCGAWDDGGQGSCGLVTDNANWPVSPAGYLYGAGVRNVFGPRWQTPTNAAGLMVIPCTPSTSRFGMMIINALKGAQNGKSVALSHWPVNASGNGTVNVWQMNSSITSAGQDGAATTINVVNGVTTTSASWPSGLNFPDPSITIIYV